MFANAGAPEAFMGMRIKTAKLFWSSAVVHTAHYKWNKKGQKNISFSKNQAAKYCGVTMLLW